MDRHLRQIRYTSSMQKILALLISLFLSSCVYLDIETPLDSDLNNTVLGDKTGRSATHAVLWLVAWGDAGTAAAAKAGGISTITHLDNHYYSILFGLYSKRETIAYGY